MPKSRTALKGKKPTYTRKKFKLGGRKSSISGLELSTEELIEKFKNPTFNKDKLKIIQILQSRGIYKLANNKIPSNNKLEKALDYVYEDDSYNYVFVR